MSDQTKTTITPEQLRAHAENLSPSGTYWVCDVLYAAADQIERLNARVKELTHAD
jgi:hypothetical protein